MKIRRVASRFLVVGLLLARPATAESILCQMDTAPAPGYIAPEISLDIGDQNEVVVRDAVISATGRQRVFGEISKDDGRRLSVVWQISEVPASKFEPRAYSLKLMVRLSIRRSDGAARITLVDSFYLDKSYVSTGSCRFSN